MTLEEGKAAMTAVRNVLANENLCSTNSNATPKFFPTESTATSTQEELFTKEGFWLIFIL